MLQLISRLLKVKLLLMIASDSDLRKNQELISQPHDKIIYRLGLRFTSNFIVQNINCRIFGYNLCFQDASFFFL